MPVKIRQTKVATNTGAASQNITISGFGTPKAAILMTSRGVTDGVPANHAMFAIGVTDGVRDRCFGYTCQDSAITSQTARRGMTDQCIFSLNTAGTIDGEAKFSGWITDGININWGDISSTGYLLDVILLGGDIQVVASSVSLNTTLSGTVSVNIGFQPDSLLVFGGGALSDLNVPTAVLCIGFADNYSGTLSQGCISYINTDNLTTTSIRGIISDTQFVINNGGDSAKYRVTSFTSTGFDAICDLAGSATISFLAIKYNSKTRHKVSSFFGPNDFGNFNVDNVGFKPQFAFNIFDLRTSFNVQTSGSDAGSMSVSCLTAPTTNNSFVTISTPNISGASLESSMADSSAMAIYDHPGNITLATLTNFNISGYSLDVVDISAVVDGASLYWVVGETYEERACDFFIKGHKEIIHSSSDLYITFENGSPIKKCNLDGGNLIPFISGTPYISGTSSHVQIDNINDIAYWIEDPSADSILKRTDFDGTNYQVLSSGSVAPMKLDIINGYIFGIDFSPYTIKRLDLDGQNETLIYSGSKAIEPNSIDIDRINQKIWWTDANNFHKEISNIDYNGSGVQDVISDFVSYIGIAVDTEDEKVYWGVVDGDTSPTMFRANTDGTNIETVVPSGFGSLRSLAVDYAFKRIYAIDVGSREIIRVGIDNLQVEILPFNFIDDGTENPTSLTIDQRFYKQLFIHGLDNLNDSIDFFIRGKASFSNDCDLFICGSETINDSLNLCIFGFDSFNENCDLFINGFEVDNNQIDLYIFGKDSLNDNIDLYINGKNTETESIDLSINGHDLSNDYIELFIYGNGVITNEIDLFIQGFDSLTSDIDLYTNGKDFISDDLDLYINGYIKEIDNIDLFINSIDDFNHSATLFINGSVVSTMMISVLYDLFIHGIDFFIDDVPLFINGNEFSFYSTDCFVYGHLLNTKSIDLFIYGKDSFSNFVNFTIFGNEETTSSFDLFIHGPELINDNIDLYIRVKEAFDIDLFIKGISVPVNQSCPALDPTASIQISDDLIEIYQSRIDALINQLGKNILLEFGPLNSPCPNCYFDPINNRSNGIYKSGGPVEFNRGQKCPYCKSVGFLQQIPTQCIKSLIKWNPKDAENYGVSVSDNKDVVRIKSLLTDGDALIRAKTAILNYDIQDIIKLRARLIKGPNIVGLRESRYIITFWELMDN